MPLTRALLSRRRSDAIRLTTRRNPAPRQRPVTADTTVHRRGRGAGAYYVEQLPNYYLDSGEPRRIWFGGGAQQLGVRGEVGVEAFLAVMAGMDPRRPNRDLGRRYDQKSIGGFDVTASAPKSVSVLWALGDEGVWRVVLDAHDTAVRELAGWIEAHAQTRYRIGGEVAVVDAEGMVAAAFRQHTSRALDPQLHTHLVIANRVKSPDGRWLALDARLVKRDQQTVSALYHVSLRTELTARLVASAGINPSTGSPRSPIREGCGRRWLDYERGFAACGVGRALYV